jgi:PAS domain S-box-containing protein
VTQRNNIAEALKKSEQHLELLSDAVPALIFYLDSEQRYKSCNETFCQWFNVKRTEVIGKTVRNLLAKMHTKEYCHTFLKPMPAAPNDTKFQHQQGLVLTIG